MGHVWLFDDEKPDFRRFGGFGFGLLCRVGTFIKFLLCRETVFFDVV